LERLRNEKSNLHRIIRFPTFKNMNRTIKILLITFLSFGVYFVLDDMFFNDFRTWLNGVINQFGISHVITYAVFGIPIILGATFMHGPKVLVDSLGLNKPVLKGVLFSLICTFPMFLGFAIVFDLNSEISLNTVLINLIAAAFFEELFFRGFLFGQLYRYTKLGFIPSVIIGALLFATLHLYQSEELSTLIGVFLTTLLGGILFAWVYTEWNYNLWVPIFLHLFMNLFWELFSVSDNAFGGIYSNVFRLITIALIIVLTVLNKRKKEIRLEINKNSIWIKKASIEALNN